LLQPPPPFLRLPRSAAAPSSADPLAPASRHAGGGAQARDFSDGVSGFPSRLFPVASRPRLRSSAHRPVTLRACLSLSLYLSSRLQLIVNGARPRRLRRAQPEGSGSEQPLLHQGGRAALGALMPQSEALPVLLALQRAEACSVPLFGTLFIILSSAICSLDTIIRNVPQMHIIMS
jgi:hypothetical protein